MPYCFPLKLSALALSLFALSASGVVFPRTNFGGQVGGGECQSIFSDPTDFPDPKSLCCGGCAFDPQGQQRAFSCSHQLDVSTLCCGVIVLDKATNSFNSCMQRSGSICTCDSPDLSKATLIDSSNHDVSENSI